MTKLWSLRWSVAKGNHFALERECSEETANEWLEIFQKDEPKVMFLISKRRPPIKVKK